VVAAWIDDSLQTGKLSQCITNTKVNSAFHPFGVGKLSTSLSGWDARLLFQVVGNIV